MSVRPGRSMPVLPEVSARVLAGAERCPNGCLISPLTPSKPRPHVWVSGDRQALAYRVVAAVSLGREIAADEDVHHECETPRCVEPSHLVVGPHGEHSAHHAEAQRQTHCSVHGTPYDRRNAKGWGICAECGREATRRYRSTHEAKPLTDEQRARRNETARIRAKTPEARAKAAEKQRARRSRIRQSKLG